MQKEKTKNSLLAKITPHKIAAMELYEDAFHAASGAIVVFSGMVRESNHGRPVSFLEYEAYPSMAEKMMYDILKESQVKWQLNYAAAVHRIGHLEIGEIAVVVVTSSGHREECYEANRYIIDTIKSEVPIWKKEVFRDGSHEWGNHCHC